MGSSGVQILLRKSLPFLFDPKNKFYPITIVATLCMLLISVFAATICILYPKRGISQSTITTTNETTDMIVGYINIIGGLIQSYFSVAWIICHRSLLVPIKNKIYKLQKGVGCEKELSWFSKETRICYSLLAFMTICTGLSEISSTRSFCAYGQFFINISFSYAISGQLGVLLQYLSSMYDSLLDVKKYESSVKWYEFLSSIFDDVWMLYQLPVLLILMWSLALSFTHFYLLLYPAFPGKILLNIVYTIWIYLFVFPTFSTIRCCTNVVRKANKFNKDLYWKMARNKSTELLNNELLDFHITAHEELTFKACGLFSLDNSLIFSITSQITTYLVIIFQVAKSGGSIFEPTMFYHHE